MNIISIITIRQGSKGLKNKNFKKIKNKYVFEYSIEYSLKLEKLLKNKLLTVVSSDSKIVENYCKKKNILFFYRNKYLASDIAQIEEVIYDVYIKLKKNFKYISLLYGNIPTRYTDEFLKSYKFLLNNPDYDCVLSMQNVEKYNPAWMFELNHELLPKKIKKGYRRQDLKQLMIHDGHTILFKSDYFIKYIKNNGFKQKFMYEAFGEKIKPMLNNKLIIDIDTKKDLTLAEAVINSDSIENVNNKV